MNRFAIALRRGSLRVVLCFAAGTSGCSYCADRFLVERPVMPRGKTVKLDVLPRSAINAFKGTRPDDPDPEIEWCKEHNCYRFEAFDGEVYWFYPDGEPFRIRPGII